MKEKFTKESVGYAQIKNEVLQDKKMSWKAKGLFSYLYSKPDDWDFSLHRIVLDSSGGKREIMTGLQELEKNRYLRRTRLKNGKMVYHLSYTQNSNEAEKPDCGNSNKPKQHVAKTATVSNKEIITNKELDSNKEIINENSPIEKQIGEVIYLFKNLNPMYKTWFNRNPVRKKCQELLDTFGFVKVKNAIGFAESIIAVEFAPEITTPAELGTKWGKLQAYYMKKRVANQNKGKNYDE
jgi:hypothetical protein